jgi:phospholipid/cholesterol/gamma-HCH transport system permease protein
MEEANSAAAGEGELSFSRGADQTLVMQLSGRWQLHGHLPSVAEAEREIASGSRRVSFDASGLEGWDTSLLTFLTQVTALGEQHKVDIDRAGLPEGVRRLLALAEAVPERKGARRDAEEADILERIGAAAIGVGSAATEFLAFLGQATLAVGRLFVGKARFRSSDLFLVIQQCGAEALPIITLISFLVGTILAFVGAVQLQQFGAAIYVADLVGIGMAREMGAMMTAIVMAGRTGAAFAAELGTMKVTQELDALRTLGVPPTEFLVLPRMIALCLMMPLLCLYSDFVGMLGGAAVGTGMLGLSPTTYYLETAAAVSLGDIAGGVFKASVYGVLVAVSGCMRGMQCGSSSSAVGDAATSAVVTGIVLVITACGIFSVLFYILGI